MSALPTVSFKEFVKNPIVALLFMSLMAVGYLYYDNKTTLTHQVELQREDIKNLKKDYTELNEKFIETLKELHNHTENED